MFEGVVKMSDSGTRERRRRRLDWVLELQTYAVEVGCGKC